MRSGCDPTKAANRAKTTVALQRHIWYILEDEKPINVAPKAGPGDTIDGGCARISVPVFRWNGIRFERASIDIHGG